MAEAITKKAPNRLQTIRGSAGVIHLPNNKYIVSHLAPLLMCDKEVIEV